MNLFLSGFISSLLQLAWEKRLCCCLFVVCLSIRGSPTRRDRVRNEVIRDRVGVAPIEEKLTQHRLRWFGHIQRRPPEAPVRIGVLERVDNVKRGRGRPKLTCDESVKRDLKYLNISNR